MIKIIKVMISKIRIQAFTRPFPFCKTQNGKTGRFKVKFEQRRAR